MKMATMRLTALVLAAVLFLIPSDPSRSEEKQPPKLIKPAASTGTGLLLEPPLDLSHYKTEDFLAASASIGADRINKKWTNPVTELPPHPRHDAHGLTEDEIKQYMLQVKRLFDEGKSVPVSDVGLISTQEDVIRRPMLNHIAVFSNSVVRVYLLVQKTSTSKNWGYFSIAQDLTVEPAVDYYGSFKGDSVKFSGTSCYKCHSSGPLAIHPARADLVNDPELAAAIGKYIADQPRSRFHFPAHEPAPPTGKQLALQFCSECHDAEGSRSSLFQVHSHPIRILVDFGYMPPDRRLTEGEVAELKAWLEMKE